MNNPKTLPPRLNSSWRFQPSPWGKMSQQREQTRSRMSWHHLKAQPRDALPLARPHLLNLLSNAATLEPYIQIGHSESNLWDGDLSSSGDALYQVYWCYSLNLTTIFCSSIWRQYCTLEKMSLGRLRLPTMKVVLLLLSKFCRAKKPVALIFMTYILLLFRV